MACFKSIAALKVSSEKNSREQLVDILSEMQKQSKQTDFQVKVNGKKIDCHRCVLSAGSKYFDKMLENGTKEARAGEVCLDNKNENVVVSIIQYIYGQDISIAWEDIKDCLEVVKSFALTELKLRIDEYVCDLLSPENCIEWLYLARRFNLQNTLVSSKKMLTTQFYEVGKSETFMKLSKEKLKELLDDVDFSSLDGDWVLETCINWILADESSRKDQLPELEAFIDISKCSQEYIKRMLDRYTNRLELISNMETYVSLNNAGTASRGLLRNTGSQCVLLGGRSSSAMNKKILQVDFQTSKYDEIGTLPEQMQRFGAAQCRTDDGVFSAGGGTIVSPRKGNGVTICSR